MTSVSMKQTVLCHHRQYLSLISVLFQFIWLFIKKAGLFLLSVIVLVLEYVYTVKL